MKVDRVEWIYIPDSATAAAALNAGEADWWEQLPPDLIPLLRKNKDVHVEAIDPIGGHTQFKYDPDDNLIALTDHLIYKRHFWSNGRNCLSKHTWSLLSGAVWDC